MKTFKIFCALTLIIVNCQLSIAQPQSPVSRPSSPVPNYQKLWSKVDSLEKKGLSKSALEQVETIYAAAKAENNAPQLVKAVIHRLKFSSFMEEDELVKSITRLKEEVIFADFSSLGLTQLSRPLLHSMLAETYWSYYQRNRWKFMNRTETVNFKDDDIHTWDKDDDIHTWDLKKIIEQVNIHYQISLDNSKLLQKTKIDFYDEVIEKGKNSRQLRPTLYDFLTNRAIDFYMNDETSLTKPANKFEMEGNDYFRNAEEFIDLKIKTEDTASFKYKAVILLQSLLRFHLYDVKEPEALVDADIRRLNFVKQHSVSEIKDSLHLDALVRLEKKYIGRPVSTEIDFEIANSLFNKPKKDLKGEDKWINKKALEKCEEAIKNFPESFGARKCKNLREDIIRTSLVFDVEKVNVPDRPFRALLKYKNIRENKDKAPAKDSAQLYLKVLKLDDDQFRELARKEWGENLVKECTKIGKQVYASSLHLPDDKDYNEHSSEIKIPALAPGVYILLCATSPDFGMEKDIVAFGITAVSNIGYINREDGKGNREFIVAERESGKLIAGAKAQVIQDFYDYASRSYKVKKGSVYTSDENGRILIPVGKTYENIHVDFTWKNDRLFSDNDFYMYQRNNYKPKPFTRTIFFTDRSIYRPGQTVYYKGIMLETDGNTNRILPKTATTVEFKDVNYQTVAKTELVTNDYGTFNGTFTAPSGGLTGLMRIENGTGSISFSVEEYKRPKFEVKFKPVKGEYKLGEDVKMTGEAKAYSGAVVDGAEVKYRVERTAYFPYPWYSRWDGWEGRRSASMEITNGIAKTNEKGEFEITFKAIPDKSIPKSNKPAFNYKVYADVVDINGETHSAEQTVSAGYVSLVMSINLPGEVNKDEKLSYTLKTANLSGEFQPAKGNISIWLLKAPDRILRKRRWTVPDKFLMTQNDYLKDFPNDVYEEEDKDANWAKGSKIVDEGFDTEKEKMVSLNQLSGQQQGRYVMEITAKDKYGEDVKTVNYFTLYSMKEKTLPFAMSNWFAMDEAKKEVGETLHFTIGSSYKDVEVVFEIEQQSDIPGEPVVSRREKLTLNNEQKQLEIPVLESYKGDFAIHLLFFKNNEVFSFNRNIEVPYTDKHLDLAFETFRDKLQPGEKEQWKLKIKGSKGDKVAAEMVAALYDASLDAFRTNTWHFDIYQSMHGQLNWASDGTFGLVTATPVTKYWNYYKPEKVERSYDRLNWFGFSGNYGTHYYRGGASGGDFKFATTESISLRESANMSMKTKQTESERPKKEPKVAHSENGTDKNAEYDGDDIPDQADITGKDHTKDLGGIKARSNFNETAFFYPNLETDEKGDVVINFTIPEALTRWKMLGFAHTKDLKYGMIQKELITQKDLMVMPNLPRFFREGDTITLVAKINNLSEKELEGTAKMVLTNAITMENLAGFKNPQGLNPQSFKNLAGLSTSVEWTIVIPSGISAITCKIVAQAGNFTDGEETTIPVLTNSMLITESMPLPFRGDKPKTFRLDKLINNSSTTLKHEKLTLEYTSNPAWYAVQALPYLMEYPYECSEQIFSRYYANSLASFIANSSPKIKAVFDLWRGGGRGTGDKGALLSNLEKNQELKALLLEETPWVMQAQDETERKKRVALLFDLNRMSNETERALKQLEKNQTPNGGWSWFAGMPDDRYITQHIVTGMGHLNKLQVINIKENMRVMEMIRKAIPYLDDRISEDYEWLKNHKVDLAKNNLSQVAIQYLYARSFFNDRIEIASKNKESFNYYKDQSAKFWLDNNRYMQGMIALALKRYANKTVPADIMKSLKENSLHSEEFGMYWKENNGGYYWHEAPIETQALLIEAFDEVANDQPAVEEMKVWLLKQKQTQDWKTTKATAEACYALLLKGTDILSNPTPLEIKVGTEKFKTGEGNAEAGTGYFKTSWSGKEIKNEMGAVTITPQKTNNQSINTSWGAIYWQYFEQLDKITPHETPLKLTKKLFLEKPSPTGPVITPIDSKTILKPGDRIKVRIELTSDRNMEYVHLKDMRASGFEPENVLSRYKYQDGLGYYESTRDAATNFFISYLNKGTYVFEYALRVAQRGEFSNGVTTIQCMYAPEFTSHSEGIRVKVGN